MSDGNPICLAEATRRAHDFLKLFEGCGCYNRWEFAGSFRRARPMVRDLEHVVIPALGSMDRNLLWDRLDELCPPPTGLWAAAQKGAVMSRAIYSDGHTRWGMKYRGVMFAGMRHEIFIADPDNWGAILAIRTGPSDLSRALVMGIARTGELKQADGYVVRADNSMVVSMPTERDYFAAAGIPWIEPEARGVAPEPKP